MNCKFFKGATNESKYIRTEVFINEQKFKHEFDEYDDYVYTLVVYDDNNKAIATGRLYEIDAVDRIYKLGRIAVLKEYRHLGIGTLVIDKLEKKASLLGAKEFFISAQTKAKSFYEKCGYVAYGKPYYEEHVEHISMKKENI